MILNDQILSNNNRTFINKSLNQGLRVDGRSFHEYRDIEYEFSPNIYGQVTLKLGLTKVLVKVSSSIIVPTKGKQNEGNLVVAVELSNMINYALELNKSSEQEILLSRFIEKNLRYSRCLDLEGLCIVANQKVFQIRVDIHYLDDGGNLLDAGNLAALAALAHFRRPEFTVKGQDVVIYGESEKAYVPLIVHHFPICITFASFNDGEQIVIDPTDEEESVCQTTLTISFNYQNELCCFSKPGLTPISPDSLINCTEVANQLSKKLIDNLKLSLKENTTS